MVTPLEEHHRLTTNARALSTCPNARSVRTLPESAPGPGSFTSRSARLPPLPNRTVVLAPREIGARVAHGLRPRCGRHSPRGQTPPARTKLVPVTDIERDSAAGPRRPTHGPLPSRWRRPSRAAATRASARRCSSNVGCCARRPAPLFVALAISIALSRSAYPPWSPALPRAVPMFTSASGPLGRPSRSAISSPLVRCDASSVSSQHRVPRHFDERTRRGRTRRTTLDEPPRTVELRSSRSFWPWSHHASASATHASPAASRPQRSAASRASSSRSMRSG
jgi:hypothetical protein